MKLITSKVKRYGDLRAKQAVGPLSLTESNQLEGLVRDMGAPEPKKRRLAKAAGKQKTASPPKKATTTKKAGKK